jgi:hypothetical protein
VPRQVYEAVRARVALSEQVKATLRALESCAKGKLPGVPGKDDLAPNGATLESLRDRTAEALPPPSLPPVLTGHASSLPPY